MYQPQGRPMSSPNKGHRLIDGHGMTWRVAETTGQFPNGFDLLATSQPWTGGLVALVATMLPGF